MKGLPVVLMFTAMTFMAWGSYGPVLHHGSLAFAHDSLRAFVFVGLAYFTVGVVIPFAILLKSGERGNWTVRGVIFSMIAGAVGALGALGVTTALGYGGQPVYVMPLVFGFAPIVNTLVTAYMTKTFNQISVIFIIGVITAAVGAGGVLVFKPTPPRAPVPMVAVAGQGMSESPELQASYAAGINLPSGNGGSDAPPEDKSLPTGSQAGDAQTEVGGSDERSAEPVDQAAGLAATEPSTADRRAQVAGADDESSSTSPLNALGIALSIIMAASCWGSYGAMLHIGQGKMNGSRLRPFACVGISYFIIAVAAPMILIALRSNDVGQWTTSGMGWSYAAGIAGAIGALGIVLAFNSGGKPYYVMPLVFGFAPVISTFITVTETGTWSLVTAKFWISLLVVIAGAVTVLTNAPRPKVKKPQEAVK